MSRPIHGVVVGLVTTVDDPEGLGRVRVQFPWLAGPDNESNWCRVATPLAGPEAGAFYQPEVGDEALVAFEQADARRPYVVGYLWSAGHAPPETDPHLRTFRSRAGHTLVFDDSGGDEHVRIEDADGNKVVLGADGITIESAGDVTIKGANVTIEATAQLTATGSPIHLNP